MQQVTRPESLGTPQARGAQQLRDAAATLGSHLRRYRTRVIDVSQREMVVRLSDRLLEMHGKEGGISRNTYRKMEAGDPKVNFAFWLAVFQEMGLLDEIVRAAEPSQEAFNQMVSTISGYGNAARQAR